jgi:signal peptidase II
MTWPALAVVLLDQITKWVVDRTLQENESITVLRGFFDLVHVRNRGMAFGLLNRPDLNLGFYFLVFATLGAMVLLLVWMFKLKDEERRIIPGLSLVLGGAVGNLIDRLRLGEVIDFLDLYLGPYHWPSFNVADSAVTVGAFWVAAYLLFPRRTASQ